MGEKFQAIPTKQDLETRIPSFLTDDLWRHRLMLTYGIPLDKWRRSSGRRRSRFILNRSEENWELNPFPCKLPSRFSGSSEIVFRKKKNNGRFPFTKKFRKFRLGCKWNMIFRFAPQKNSGIPDFLVETSWWQFVFSSLSPLSCLSRSVKGTQSRFCARARVWFLNRRLRIQRCGNWHRAFTNPFASSSINFGFVLKLLRIKDQWYTVLVKCQFVRNRDLSVLTSMPFDETSSGGRCYGAGRRRLSFGSFQKGLESRERTEK